MPDQTPREQLDALLSEHVDYWEHDHRKAVDVAIEQGWRPGARIIEDRAELDCLDYPAIVREEPADPDEFFPAIWEMGYQTGWCRVGHRFFDLDDCTPRLPVRVLHTPENGDTP